MGYIEGAEDIEVFNVIENSHGNYHAVFAN